MHNRKLPVFYSFRRCPYAMRARMALLQCKLQVEIREVKLSQKPLELIQASAKATVPVLLLADGQTLDESLDIMHWALQQHDPERWINDDLQLLTQQLISENDESFKQHLDRYKYSDRYPENSQQEYRQRAEKFVQKLENLLTENHYLLSAQVTLADMAIMPFVRQFAGVDADWFASSSYKRVREWLNELISSELFSQVMRKYDFWKAGDENVYFPARILNEYQRAGNTRLSVTTQ